MKVSAQYARNHFDELLQAMDNGEEVEVSREGRPSFGLIVLTSPGQHEDAASRTKRRLGAARGKIQLAKDWDSAETNASIAAELEGFSAADQPRANEVSPRYTHLSVVAP